MFVKDFTGIEYKLVLISILVVLLYSISDEVHQLFVPGRSGEAFDVMIDTMGGFISTNILYLIYRRKKLHE